MRTTTFLMLLGTIALSACDHAKPSISDLSANKRECGCGPDYCRGDSRYPSVLAAKKKRLKDDGYPDRLIALLDRASPCVAAVEQAPDTFTLQVVELDGSRTAFAWTPEDEEIAKKNLKEKKIKSYQIFNVNRALQCCDDPKYDERSDYDRSLDLNTDLALVFK